MVNGLKQKKKKEREKNHFMHMYVKTKDVVYNIAMQTIE